MLRLLKHGAVSGLSKGPRNSEELGRELVRQKKLTPYQAKESYCGRGRLLVLGNYVTLEKLGQGGMGLVVKAEHRRMERLLGRFQRLRVENRFDARSVQVRVDRRPGT